jgi:hypothetical protein
MSISINNISLSSKRQITQRECASSLLRLALAIAANLVEGDALLLAGPNRRLAVSLKEHTDTFKHAHEKSTKDAGHHGAPQTVAPLKRSGNQKTRRNDIPTVFFASTSRETNNNNTMSDKNLCCRVATNRKTKTKSSAVANIAPQAPVET